MCACDTYVTPPTPDTQTPAAQCTGSYGSFILLIIIVTTVRLVLLGSVHKFDCHTHRSHELHWHCHYLYTTTCTFYIFACPLLSSTVFTTIYNVYTSTPQYTPCNVYLQCLQCLHCTMLSWLHYTIHYYTLYNTTDNRRGARVS